MPEGSLSVLGVRDPISTSTLVLQTGGEGGGERCVLAVAMVLLVLELTCPLPERLRSGKQWVRSLRGT